MAKESFIYYKVDTDRFHDLRIKKLKKEFGTSGFAVYDFILCEIYREKGCFIVWDESTAFDVAEYWNIKETLVNEIVQYCCYTGLFNKALYTCEGVLSSKAILTRFIEMSEKAKRKDVKIPEFLKHLLEEMAKVPEELPKVQEELDKVKYSKVKESKVVEEEAPPPVPELPKTDVNGKTIFFSIIDMFRKNNEAYTTLCVTVQKKQDYMTAAIKDYHYSLEEKSQYPMTRESLIAGLRRRIENGWTPHDRNGVNGSKNHGVNSFI